MSKLGEDLSNASVFISIEVSKKQKSYRNFYQPSHVENLKKITVQKKLSVTLSKVQPNLDSCPRSPISWLDYREGLVLENLPL
jgi:hypothetical protein